VTHDADPLAPFTGAHEGHIYATGTTPQGWFAACLCGFVAEPRPTPGAAAGDLIGHRPPQTKDET